MKRAALIVNPYASTVTADRVRAVEAELGRSFELTVSQTERPRHATELARAIEAVDAVVVYGGDGLVNEVVNGLDGTIALGIVPGGGKNVVVRSLGIPLDAVDAARALAAAAPRRISIGRVNGRRFVFAAGLGFDAELVRRVDELGRRADGRRPGDVAFVREAVKLLAGRRGRFEPVLEIDGHGRAAFVLVSNGGPYSYIGSRPLRVAPEARFELGLDVVAPRSVTPRSIPRLFGYALIGRGQQATGDLVYVHDVDSIVVRCDRPLALQADGEDLGEVTEARFGVERRALAVLVPG
jgi:diacylglycerol kinase family enzyme